MANNDLPNRLYKDPVFWVKVAEIASFLGLGLTLTCIGSANTEDSLGLVLASSSLPMSCMAAFVMNITWTKLRILVFFLTSLLLPAILVVPMLTGAYESQFLLDFCLFSMGVFLLLGILKGFRKFLKYYLVQAASDVISIVTLLLIPGVLFSYISCALLLNSKQYEDIGYVLLVFTEIIFIQCIVMLWHCLHKSLFNKTHFEEVITLVESEDAVEYFYETYKEKAIFSHMWSNSAKNCSYFFLGTSLAIDVFLFVLSVIGISKGENSDFFKVLVYYKLLVPAFWITGFVYSTMKFEFKANTGIVLGVISIIAFICIGKSTTENSLLEVLLTIGIPLSILFWISMEFIYSHHQSFYFVLIPFLFLTVLLPVGFLLPLKLQGILSDGFFYGLLGALVFLGLCYASIFIADYINSFKAYIYLWKQCLPLFQFRELVRYFYTATLISTYFIYFLIIYTYKIDSWKIELSVSSLIIITFAYVYTKILENIKLYNRSYPMYSLSDMLTIKKDPSVNYKRNRTKKTHCQIYIYMLGCMLPIMILVIILIAESSYLISSLVLILGLCVLGCGSVIILELKTLLRQFGQQFVAYGIGSLWAFLILPFFIILPMVYLISGEASMWGTGSVFILIITGMSCLSISLNKLIDRLENEKKAKYVTSQLQDTVQEIGVKIDSSIARTIYDQFSKIGSDRLNELLKSRRLVDLSDNQTFDQEIYLVSRAKTAKKKTTKVDKKKGCWDIIKKYLKKKNNNKIAAEDEVVIDTHRTDRVLPEIKMEELDNIRPSPLNRDEIDNLLHEEQFNIISENPEFKRFWLRVLFFSAFSHGLDKHGKPYMTLYDLRQFVRLSGLTKHLSSARVDLLFTKATKKYNADNHNMSFIKIYEENFKEILRELSYYAFSNLKTIFSSHIYPNLVTVLPHMANLMYEEKVSIMINDRIMEFERPSISTVKEMSYTQKTFKEKCPLLIKIFDKLTKLVNNLSKCMRKFFAFLFRVLFPTSSAEVIVLKEREITEKVNMVEWPDLSNKITERLDTVSYELDVKNHTIKIEKVSVNAANLLSIAAHGIEILIFTSIALSDEIGWTSSDTSFIVLENSYWLISFMASLGLSFIFIVMVKPISSLVREGRLGLNKDLSIATFPQPQFFFEKTVSLLGESFYLFIVSGLLSIFSCQEEADRSVLTKNPEMECYTDEYWTYFSLGIFCFTLYYPSATLLFPNIMYQNRSLDLKFDTTFLVIESQGKLLIAGVSAFFARDSFIWLHLLVVIIVCGGLSMYAYFTKPCLVISYNYWKVSGYFIPIWASLCALLNYYTEYNLLAIILLSAGIPVIVISAIIIKLLKR